MVEPDPRTPLRGPWWSPTAWPAWSSLVLVALVALAARLVPVLLGGGLTSVLFDDDGVYYTAGALLGDGRLPYQDFVLLHPPGIALVVAPFATVGRVTSDPTGLALARLGFMAVGAVTAVLVTVAGRRAGAVAGLVAGLFYALWWPVAHTESSPLLEPLVNLGVAAALVALADPRTASRRRLALGGAALGLACTAKLWAGVAVVVLAVWVWRRAGVRALVAPALGWLAAVVVVCLPFFVVAPRAMTQMVLLDQLDRPGNGIGIDVRLADALGLSVSLAEPSAATTAVAVALLIALAAAAVLAAWRVPLARPWVALLVADLVVLGAVGVFFAKYVALAGLPLALVVGAAVHAVLGLVRGRARVLTPLVVVGVCAGLVAVAAGPFARTVGRPVDTTGVRALLVDADCVTADNPLTLIQADLLGRALDHDCAVIADLNGLALHVGEQRWTGDEIQMRRDNKAWQDKATRYLLSGDAFLLARFRGGGLDRASLRCLQAQELVGEDGSIRVFLVRPDAGSLTACADRVSGR